MPWSGRSSTWSRCVAAGEVMTGLRGLWTRAGGGPPRKPLYHRLLRLRRHRPGPVVTFLCFEGSMIGAAVLALAEVLPWLSVLLVPAAIATVVKLHDLVVQATPQRAPSPS